LAMWLCDYVDVILNSLFASILVEKIQSMKSTSRTCSFVDIILTLYRLFMSLPKMYLNNYTAELMFT